MKKLLKRVFVLGLLVLSVVFLASCRGADERKKLDEFKGSDKFKIVTTTTMLHDLAEQIGKDKVVVHSIMDTGVDPHTYRARTYDTYYLEAGDMVIISGLHLEAEVGETILAMGEKVVTATQILLDKHNNKDGVELRPWEAGTNLYDPHIWFDVTYWQYITAYIAEEMGKKDVENKDYYIANANNYIKELEDLHKYVDEKVSQIPSDKRILVTAHDAFSYFAKLYGFEVLSIQGISTEQEADAGHIEDLVDQIKNAGVYVVFIESSVPKKTIESLVEAAKAKKVNLTIGGELYSDSLGDWGTESGTYIGMVKHNVDTIYNGFKEAGIC